MVALPVEPPQRFECIAPTYAGKRNPAVNIGKWMFRPRFGDRCDFYTHGGRARSAATHSMDSRALRPGPDLSVSAARRAFDRQAPAERADRGRNQAIFTGARHDSGLVQNAPRRRSRLGGAGGLTADPPMRPRSET